MLESVKQMLKDQRGAAFQAIMLAPIYVIMLGISFAILDPMTQVAFNTLDTSTTIAYVGPIKILLGAIGVIVGILVIMSIINEFKTQDQYTG